LNYLGQPFLLDYAFREAFVEPRYGHARATRQEASPGRKDPEARLDRPSGSTSVLREHLSSYQLVLTDSTI